MIIPPLISQILLLPLVSRTFLILRHKLLSNQRIISLPEVWIKEFVPLFCHTCLRLSVNTVEGHVGLTLYWWLSPHCSCTLHDLQTLEACFYRALPQILVCLLCVHVCWLLNTHGYVSLLRFFISQRLSNSNRTYWCSWCVHLALGPPVSASSRSLVRSICPSPQFVLDVADVFIGLLVPGGHCPCITSPWPCAFPSLAPSLMPLPSHSTPADLIHPFLQSPHPFTFFMLLSLPGPLPHCPQHPVDPAHVLWSPLNSVYPSPIAYHHLR